MVVLPRQIPTGHPGPDPGPVASGFRRKSRLNKTEHPYNRLFLIFDERTGIVLFFIGLLPPEAITEAASFEHAVHHRGTVDRVEVIRLAALCRNGNDYGQNDILIETSD